MTVAANTTQPPATKPQTKIDVVLTMLARAEGATIAELTGATGWQSHTVRAALTGLRKKNHIIDKRERDGSNCYFAATVE